MDAVLLIRTFYSALSRDLLIYMLSITVAALIAWHGWYRKRIKHRHDWLAGALALTILGGGLFIAAHSYRVSIPTKLNADLIAVQTNLESARQAFIERYGAERGVPHFRQLAVIWAIVSGVAIVTMLTHRRPAVLGICNAILFLCIASFVLDLSAFMRDIVYAAQWIEMKR